MLRNDSLSTNIEAEVPVETQGPHNCIINCFRQALTLRAYICDFKNALLDENRMAEITLLVSYCNKCHLLQLHQPAAYVRGCENNTISTAFLIVRLYIFET